MPPKKAKGKTVTKKPKQSTPIIGAKDQKILWSRAAGRCSMRDCRIELTTDVTAKDSATLGEMCHIVGEKNSKLNARGISTMALAYRNKYSNLILLCAHHHRVIDKNEKKYTIELLHLLKDEHEIWVTETLAANTIKPDELVYSSLIDLLSVSLMLDKWNWFSGNAIRHLIHSDFIHAYAIVAERKLATVYPGTKPALENAIKGLMQSYLDYIDHYLSQATHDGGSYHPDNSYKKFFPNPHYDYYSEQQDLWARKDFILLCHYTVMVNTFVNAVRAYSNPSFYVVKGNFILYDELGTHLGDPGTMILPKLEPTLIELERIEKEIEKFHKKNPVPDSTRR